MLRYLETHITDHCNLKCASCLHFSSLVEKPYFKDLQTFELEAKRISEICGDPTIMYNILGGEPFLHPDVIEFPKIVRKYLPQAEILITNNGTLLHKLTDEQIQELNDTDVYICTSDYGVVDLSEVSKKFKHFYQMPRGQMYNTCFDLHGSQDPAFSYKNCDQQHKDEEWNCSVLRDGKLYPCPMSAYMDVFTNYFHLDLPEFKEQGIDIFRHTAEEIDKYLNEPTSACRYCKTTERYNTMKDFEISKRDIKEWI